MQYIRYMALVLAGLCCSAPVLAQTDSYPSRAIRIVVPFPPGGGTDTAARQMAERLSKELKTDIVVDNKPGAGGNIGALYVAKAAPDGYTLLVGTVGTQIVNQIMFPTIGFDPEQDFAPAGWFSSVPNVLVVGAQSPYHSVQELIAGAKTRPEGLVYGSGGAGSSIHLAAELLKEMTGMAAEHIPYKGSAPALVDLIGGRVDFMVDNLSSANPHIQSGKLRILAVTTSQRLEAYPDVPTLAEIPGLSSYEAVGWTGLFAPHGISPEKLAILSDAMSSTTDIEAIRAKVAFSGAEYVGAGSEAFDEFLVKERARWVPIARKALVK